ncbi:hypothetical protein GQ600_11768 [Phytophthora cactorum]|nr:hypothetical protein GQ600_11768 [Phytophthora cactorum]
MSHLLQCCGCDAFSKKEIRTNVVER